MNGETNHIDLLLLFDHKMYMIQSDNNELVNRLINEEYDEKERIKNGKFSDKVRLVHNKMEKNRNERKIKNQCEISQKFL